MKIATRLRRLPVAVAVAVIAWWGPAASAVTSDGTRWPINLGPTGVRAHLRPDAPTTLVVAEVMPGTPATGKIGVGDEIVGVNGRPFTVPHRFGYGMDIFGYEGPMMDVGNALEESLAPGRNGEFSFLVGRGGQPRTVTLQLPAKLGQFSRTFPFACKKSDLILAEVFAHLLRMQRPDGSWSDRSHLDTFATLALLASGDARHMPAVTRSVRHMAGATGRTMKPLGLPNWQYTLFGIVLGEYYLATGERWVLPELDEIRIALEDSQLMPGEPGLRRHGGWGHRPGFEGYGPIGILTGQGLAAYGLMLQAGLTVDPRNYAEATRFLARGTNNIGYVWYADDGASDANRYADMGRTGMSAIAHGVSPTGGKPFTDIVTRNAQCIGAHPQTFIDTHGSPILGIGWTAVGAAARPESFRKLMDYHRWFFNLARNPDGTYYYQPNRDSNDQDYKPGNDLPGTAAVALALAVKYKSLRIMGAKVFIEGVDASRLSKHTTRPYELIAQGRYGPAHHALHRERAQLAREPPRQATEDDLRTIDAMTAHLDRRLETALERLRALDSGGDVVSLDRALTRQRAAWSGVKAFDAAVEPIVASLAAEPRRTTLQRGREFNRLLARFETQPTATHLRALKAFGELHADDPYGRRALEAAALLESASAEERARYFKSLDTDAGE